MMYSDRTEENKKEARVQTILANYFTDFNWVQDRIEQIGGTDFTCKEIPQGCDLKAHYYKSHLLALELPKNNTYTWLSTEGTSIGRGYTLWCELYTNKAYLFLTNDLLNWGNDDKNFIASVQPKKGMNKEQTIATLCEFPKHLVIKQWDIDFSSLKEYLQESYY